MYMSKTELEDIIIIYSKFLAVINQQKQNVTNKNMHFPVSNECTNPCRRNSSYSSRTAKVKFIFILMFLQVVL